MKNWLAEHIDFLVLFVVGCLLTIGIVSIYSATYDTGSRAFFHKQMIFAAIGAVFMIVIIATPFRTLQLLSVALYGASIIMLAMVLIAGKIVAGSKSWFGIGGF